MENFSHMEHGKFFIVLSITWMIFLLSDEHMLNVNMILLSLSVFFIHSDSMSVRKMSFPSASGLSLGIEIDSTSMSLRLPSDRLNRLNAPFLSRNPPPVNCNLSQGLWTFLRPVIHFINKVKHSSHRCRLTSQFHVDILRWKQFLRIE